MKNIAMPASWWTLAPRRPWILYSKRGEYIGGAIAPGLLISLEALFQRASKLPRIEIVKPKEVVGKNTVNSIQAGIFFGYVGLVDGIVQRIQKENGVQAKVVATGGLAPLVASECSTISEVDEFLTLEGLRIIHERNSPTRSEGESAQIKGGGMPIVMATAELEKLRNVGLLGQGGSGKTSLGEAMLFTAGATQRLGKVQDGTSVLDHEPEEIKHYVSISTAFHTLTGRNIHSN